MRVMPRSSASANLTPAETPSRSSTRTRWPAASSAAARERAAGLVGAGHPGGPRYDPGVDQVADLAGQLLRADVPADQVGTAVEVLEHGHRGRIQGRFDTLEVDLAVAGYADDEQFRGTAGRG